MKAKNSTMDNRLTELVDVTVSVDVTVLVDVTV